MACWGRAKKGAAGISCALIGGEAGVGVGGGDGSRPLARRYMLMLGYGI